MSTLKEIESAAEKLPPEQQEELIRFLAARHSQPVKPASARQPYRTRTHPGGFLPGIDADKLGQLPDDF